MSSIHRKKIVSLCHEPNLKKGDILLPASKSLSNRVLILNALCEGRARIENLSEARDTRTMQALLSAPDKTIMDVKDAGTTMRFLTAYFSVTGQEKIITGTERMHQRPIGILVDALRHIGANIDYLGQEGYPPLQTKGFTQSQSQVNVRGDVSSQYISALLMAAPQLPEGLSLNLTGKVGSKPYIRMTLALMERFGIKAHWEGSCIHIAAQKYCPCDYTVEPDWSAASYWYSFCALSKSSEITLPYLSEDSLQGDRSISSIMEPLGVKSDFYEKGVRLTKSAHGQSAYFDFSDCPDLAQTVAVTCAAKGIRCQMTGLESLRIKETDRILALQKELSKIGAEFLEEEGKWSLIPAKELPKPVAPIQFDTYEDHRMAMAFAPLGTLFDIIIKEPGVVDKSYPKFWEEVAKLGMATF